MLSEKTTELLLDTLYRKIQTLSEFVWSCETKIHHLENIINQKEEDLQYYKDIVNQNNIEIDDLNKTINKSENIDYLISLEQKIKDQEYEIVSKNNDIYFKDVKIMSLEKDINLSMNYLQDLELTL